jgi:hypothetical protein
MTRTSGIFVLASESRARHAYRQAGLR